MRTTALPGRTALAATIAVGLLPLVAAPTHAAPTTPQSVTAAHSQRPATAKLAAGKTRVKVAGAGKVRVTWKLGQQDHYRYCGKPRICTTTTPTTNLTKHGGRYTFNNPRNWLVATVKQRHASGYVTVAVFQRYGTLPPIEHPKQKTVKTPLTDEQILTQWAASLPDPTRDPFPADAPGVDAAAFHARLYDYYPPYLQKGWERRWTGPDADNARLELVAGIQQARETCGLAPVTIIDNLDVGEAWIDAIDWMKLGLDEVPAYAWQWDFVTTRLGVLHANPGGNVTLGSFDPPGWVSPFRPDQPPVPLSDTFGNLPPAVCDPQVSHVGVAFTESFNSDYIPFGPTWWVTPFTARSTGVQ